MAQKGVLTLLYTGVFANDFEVRDTFCAFISKEHTPLSTSHNTTHLMDVSLVRHFFDDKEGCCALEGKYASSCQMANHPHFMELEATKINRL